MNKILLLLLLLTICKNIQSQNLTVGHGTTILTFISNDSIIIASDTKQSIYDSSGNKIKDTIVGKIGFTNNIIYGFANLSFISYNNQEIFNPYKIFNWFAIKEKPEMAFSSFNDSIIKNLKFAIKQQGQQLIDLINLKGGTSYIVASFLNNKPIVAIGSYYISGNIKNFEVIQKEEELSNMPFLNIRGMHDHIDSVFINNKRFFDLSISSIYDKLNYLIKLEADNHPEIVGLPIDILILKPKRYKWLIKNM